MASQVPVQHLGEAVLQFVENGTFPQSDEVASAPVPLAALGELQRIIGETQEKTKAEVRSLSRHHSSDVDGWIAQARKLQTDIERSKATAREIVQHAELTKTHTAQVQDAASKVSLLYSELAYMESLTATATSIRDIYALYNNALAESQRFNDLQALRVLRNFKDAIEGLGAYKNIEGMRNLLRAANGLTTSIKERTIHNFFKLVHVDITHKRVVIHHHVEGNSAVSLDNVIQVLDELGLLEEYLMLLSRALDRTIFKPSLLPDRGSVYTITVDGSDMLLSERVTNATYKHALETVHTITQYLSTSLPTPVATQLSQHVITKLVEYLTENWLNPAVPVSIEDAEAFEEMLPEVSKLAKSLDNMGWHGQGRLREWVHQAPDIWLMSRTQADVESVKWICLRRLNSKETVYRTETQLVQTNDAAFTPAAPDSSPAAMAHASTEQEEDWGADWGAEGDAQVEQDDVSQEEDLSAWGIDEDSVEEPAVPAASETSVPSREEQVEDVTVPAQVSTSGSTPPEDFQTPGTEPDQADEDDADAWGWGDEEGEASSAAAQKGDAAAQPSKKSSGQQAHMPPTQELTLKERYTVTGIPISLMELFKRATKDVYTCQSRKIAITPAAGGLYDIPKRVLEVYRATALTHYSKEVAGDMLIYNDCTWLSEELRKLAQDVALEHATPPSRRRYTFDISSEIAALDAFAKQAYGRAMESQRTIIRDLLDGAQDFQSCTRPPYSTECDNAIQMTVDRIKEVKRQWESILSPSTLYQSLGSLISTAFTKFINDVEEIADIGAEESKQLHVYCQKLNTLSECFESQAPSDGHQSQSQSDSPQGLNHNISVYVPNWFRFQYFSEILVASLADIRYFWTDGELRLEMSREEVCDLIEALFQESDLRRRTIGEIRRG